MLLKQKTMSIQKGCRYSDIDREIFVGIEELRYVAKRWRLDYNHHRPHSSLGYVTPAVYAALCMSRLWSHDNWYKKNGAGQWEVTMFFSLVGLILAVVVDLGMLIS